MQGWHYNTIIIVPMKLVRRTKKNPPRGCQVYVSWAQTWGLDEQFVPTIGLDGLEPPNSKDIT